MLKIAITGGIGSGKTAATDYLKESGYVVIDADEISRAMTAAGGKAIPYIRENFGDDFILADGSLDRKMMRELVHNDKNALRLLEKGTTEVVQRDIAEILEVLAASGEKVAFVAIPLLFETGSQDDYDESWLIHADTDIRIRRIQARDGLSEDMIHKILANQLPESVKLELADVVIDNSGTLEELYSGINRELSRLSVMFK